LSLIVHISSLLKWKSLTNDNKNDYEIFIEIISYRLAHAVFHIYPAFSPRAKINLKKLKKKIDIGKAYINLFIINFIL